MWSRLAESEARSAGTARTVDTIVSQAPCGSSRKPPCRAPRTRRLPRGVVSRPGRGWQSLLLASEKMR